MAGEDDDVPELPEWPCVGSGVRFGSDIKRLVGLAGGGRVAVATSPRHGRIILLAHAARLAIQRGETVAWVRVKGDGEGLEAVVLRTEADLDRVVFKKEKSDG